MTIAPSFSKSRSAFSSNSANPMCLILDNDVCHKAIAPKDHSEALPVLNWLWSEKGHLVYGGKNRSELSEHAKVHKLLEVLWQAGRAERIDDGAVDRETLVVKADCTLKSDDPHVLALARLSGARTLWTNDGPLMDDFRDSTIISPRGSVYTKADHTDLLCHVPGCRKWRAIKARRSGKP
jgi:hypothetical protein